MAQQVTTTSTEDSEAVDTATLAAGFAAAATSGEARSEARQASEEAGEAQETAEAAGAAAVASVTATEALNKRVSMAEARAMAAEERAARLESYLVVRDQPEPEPEPPPARVKDKDEPPRSIQKKGKEKVPFWKRWDGGE